MSDTTAAAPRADPEWWDIPAVTAMACEILRIGSDDPDIGRIEFAARVACAAIDDFLDRCEPLPTPTPDPVMQSAAMTTVEIYRRKDAPFGVLNSWSPDDYGPVRIGIDWLNGVRFLLTPYKCGWGIA